MNHSSLHQAMTDPVQSTCLPQNGCFAAQDAKVVDNACLALSRIAEAFAHRPDGLNMLCEFGLISNAVQLVQLSLCAVLPLSVNLSCHLPYLCRNLQACCIATEFETSANA